MAFNLSRLEGIRGAIIYGSVFEIVQLLALSASNKFSETVKLVDRAQNAAGAMLETRTLNFLYAIRTVSSFSIMPKQFYF